MRVLVTFAVEAEFRPWRKRHTFEPVKFANLSLHRARIGDAEVSVLLTGIGPKRARASLMGVCTHPAAQDRWFDCCLSVGLAGSLRSQHHPAEILAARRVQPEESHRDLRADAIASDAELLSMARDCGAKIVGSFLTADRIIVTAREKADLGQKADAVDMESFDVLKEAAAWGAKGLAVRAVSDSAEEDLPIDFNRVVTPEGKISMTGMLRELRGDPGKFPALVRFGSKSRQAARALASFLDRFVPALAAGGTLVQQPAIEEVSAT